MAISPNTTTLPSPQSRRRFLTLAGGLAAATAAASAVAVQAARAGGHPDAELIRLGKEFDRQFAIVQQWFAEGVRLHPIFEAEIERRNTPKTSDLKEWFEVRREVGLEGVYERENAEHEALTGISRAIWAIPATTFAGLLVWAKASAFESHHLGHFDESEEDMDWDHQAAFKLYTMIERLAAQEAVS